MSLKTAAGNFGKKYLRIFLLLLLFAVRLFLPVEKNKSIIEENSILFSATKTGGDNAGDLSSIEKVAANLLKMNKPGRNTEK